MSAPRVSSPDHPAAPWRLACPQGHTITVQHAGPGIWAIGVERLVGCEWCTRAFERLEKLCDRSRDAEVEFLLELVVKAGDIGHE